MNVSVAAVSAINWAFIGVISTVTLGRYMIRYADKKRFFWDDFFHLVAYAAAFVHVLTYQYMFYYGVPFLAAITHRGPILPQQELQDYATGFHNWQTAESMVFFVCEYAVKVSFLLFYRSIFKSSSMFMRFWWAVAAFTLVSFWIDMAGVMTLCGSPSKLSDLAACTTPEANTYTKKAIIYTAIINMVNDISIMVLPLYMLSTIQIRRAQRIGLAFLFSIGTIIIIFDILRIIFYFVALNSDSLQTAALWASMESNVTVLVSCLPTYRTLLTNEKRQGRERFGDYDVFKAPNSQKDLSRDGRNGSERSQNKSVSRGVVGSSRQNSKDEPHWDIESGVLPIKNRQPKPPAKVAPHGQPKLTTWGLDKG